MIESGKIIVKNKNDESIECDVLFTFDNDITKKSYIVYTDNSRDSEGNIQVFASIYDPKQDNPRLEPIETEQEWKIIETILNTLQDEIKKKDNNQGESGDNEQ